MIFTVEQVRAIRAGRITAALLPTSEKVRAGSVRLLRRRIPATEDRPARTETVMESSPDGAEQVAVVMTVLAVRDLDVAAIAFSQARAAGFRTTAALHAWWASEHPRTPIARLVSFALGDLRDLPRLLAPSGRAGGDYTSDPFRAMRDEPEAVSKADQTIISTIGRQAHARARADEARRLAARPAAERLRAIQARGKPRRDL